MCALPYRGALTHSREARAAAPPPTVLGLARAEGAVNQNPRDIGLLKLLLEDFATHDRTLLEPGFWAVAVHRLGNARMDIRPRLLRAPFTLAYKALHTAVNWGFGIDLCYSVKLGRRVRLWHHGAMVLAARSIGDDVHIRHSTTFGVLRRSAPHEKPIIGDRVDVGVGSFVLGAIEVGHDSIIGANSVVIRDVPPFTTVVGSPARPIGGSTPEDRAAAPRPPLWSVKPAG